LDLGSAGIISGGILAPGRYLDSGEKEYDLELHPVDIKCSLSSRIRYPGWQKIGGFYFNPEAIEAGLGHLYDLTQKAYQLLVVDEIGPFELDGLLWAPAIPGLLEKNEPMIWTVRNRIVYPVCDRWKLENPHIINLDEIGSESALKNIRIWFERCTGS
jgi:nucleoside-triphosphatase THEP1